VLRSGAWARQVADEFPTARVIGLDLSPIQPTLVPLNCEFMVGDLTQDLGDFNEGSIDLVHSRQVTFQIFANKFRMVGTGVRRGQWDKYINDTFRILKPGAGWAQFVETSGVKWDDDSVPEDSLYSQVTLP
jgi:Methyltransferase domain